MNSNDILIVSQLRSDARKPILEISTCLKICRATVTDRLRILQTTVIQKYIALVDFKKLGYPVQLCFSITLAEEDKEVFCRYIQQHPLLNNLYKLQEGFDYFIEMHFPTKKEAEDFLSSLENAFSIIEKQVFFVDQELVRESFFPDPAMHRGG